MSVLSGIAGPSPYNYTNKVASSNEVAGLRSILIVAIPAAIVATVFLTSFVYSCYRYLVTPVLAEASTASAASAAATMHAPQQEQKIPVIIVQPGQQVAIAKRETHHGDIAQADANPKVVQLEQIPMPPQYVYIVVTQPT